MHRLRTYSSVIRFRLAALFWLAASVLMLSGLGLMGWGIYTGERQWIQYGAIALAVVVPVVILQWASAARAFCPLCMVPSLARKSCQKNRKARKLLGSYRTRVALSVTFRGHFVCPYCGEPTCVQVRESSSSQAHGHRADAGTS